MGSVLNASDLDAIRKQRSVNLKELGVAPVCMAPGEMSPGHSHTEVEEVLIVKSGKGQIQIENDTFKLKKGSVAVVPAGQFHAICNTGKKNLEGVIIYNSNYERDKVVLKSREEHFAAPEPSVDEICAEVKAMKKALKKLDRKLTAVA